MARITVENLPDLARFQRRSHANSMRLAIVSNADSTFLVIISHVVSMRATRRSSEFPVPLAACVLYTVLQRFVASAR